MLRKQTRYCLTDDCKNLIAEKIDTIMRAVKPRDERIFNELYDTIEKLINDAAEMERKFCIRERLDTKD